MGTHPIFESDFDCLTEKMALENFLWEFGCKDEEWLKPKKNNHEPCDGVVQQEDVDMLRNVQGPPENMVAPPFENPMQSRYNLFGIQVQRWCHCCYRLSCNCWWLHC